ncbi:MAG: tetratricopeptide repeat protein [Nitrospirales bacterium]|nr:tetratricopeptide repeat protein [Nitrospirales bacterium]
MLLLVFIVMAGVSRAASSRIESSTGKIRITVFPFNDTSHREIDTRLSSVVQAELDTRDFIETIPPEVVRRVILEVEPSFGWAERRRFGTAAGVLWKIEPKMVERVSKKVRTDFAVYGDISRFDGKWVINAYSAGVGGVAVKAFTLSGEGEEEIPAKLAQLAADIVVFLREETIVAEAEEEMRKFSGGIYSLPVAVGKMEKLVPSYRGALPLKALLLDLYLRDEAHYRKKIVPLASALIAQYDPAHEADTRYLLSLSLDPFAVLARAHEGEEEWAKALAVREKALQVFSFDEESHRRGIGLDAYALARFYEKKGRREQAVEYYRKALSFLPGEAPEREFSRESLGRLGRQAP